MAKNDSKRYYWLKLKKDFFQQHQIKVLKALPNGKLYALIYLELLAESTTHDGELRYSKMLPYDTVTLASVIDEDKDNVEKAIEMLVRLELVEVLDDGTIFMREIQKLIGSETGQAIRKREAKGTGGKFYPKNTQEIRDKSIEYRDKNERDIYNDISSIRNIGLDSEADKIARYVSYYNPTDEQYEKIKEAVFDNNIRHLDQYVERIMSETKDIQ